MVLDISPLRLQYHLCRTSYQLNYHVHSTYPPSHTEKFFSKILSNSTLIYQLLLLEILPIICQYLKLSNCNCLLQNEMVKWYKNDKPVKASVTVHPVEKYFLC